MAVYTRIGWILSRPFHRQELSISHCHTHAVSHSLPHTCCLTLAATHMLRIDTHLVEEDLDDQLRRFWVLESLAIMKDELSV